MVMIAFIALGILILTILLHPGRCRTDRPQEPIIDMHVHVAGLGADSDCFITSELLDNWRYNIYLKAFGTSEKELRANGDALIFERIAERLDRSRLVDGAVLLALDKVYDRETGRPQPERTEVYIPNDFVRDGCRQFDNLHYGASVNPYREDWEEQLIQADRDGAVLIKWLPAVQQIDPSAPGIEPFYRKLVELDLPLLVHTGAERSFSSSHDRLGDPRLLIKPLKAGVTVIAAHVATTGSHEGEAYIDRLLPLLQQYDNLYSDISGLTQLNKMIYPGRVARTGAISHKLLYGSDFPLISCGIGPFRLVSGWNFCWNLSWRQLWFLQRVKNDWDRDLLLKQALGFPDAVFTRPARLLNLTTDRQDKPS
ncbi:metal-dependent hydrolase [Geothermobacter hydrogeniphilus]|uniref:Metal-dependent hydrolase n=1 Tax=Geothermobacter hydrogeniphilus TaxID=1969733 RepID=A0A2K2H6M0_9BACT|nr:amidohydrolase family protein [Geothermobacter hydrogeniphilus]PNU18965.1 metal-dependent hydrolase [Geothermobacter hydrogeniphilus]